MTRARAAEEHPAAAASPRRGALEPRLIGVFWRRELTRWWRDRSQLFSGFARTVLWLVILGFGLGAALRDIEGYTYAQYILPGVITLNVLFASLQSAISLVWDREVGVMREVLVSPAPMTSVALGKVLGGATISVIVGSIPLLFTPLIQVQLTPLRLLSTWGVMFLMGMLLTSFGVMIATRMKTFEGFGAISNGVILPLYFLSGSIFPIRGIIGGVGFLDIPADLRDQLRDVGIYALGGGWVVQLPVWLQVLVYLNPVSYLLDLMRWALLGFRQLPAAADLSVAFVLPIIAIAIATRMMNGMRRTH
ncbi:MAG: ABC transporter permease [Trueperaceae bacterium]